MQRLGNLINDELCNSGVPYESISCVTGDTVASVTLATRDEIGRAAAGLATERAHPSKEEVFAFLDRLKIGLEQNRQSFFEKTCLETGFIAADCSEIVDEAIHFLDHFSDYVPNIGAVHRSDLHGYPYNSDQATRMIRRPYRCIGAIVPQNAPMTLGVIIIASALYAGSRVLLRPPRQSSATGALLAQVVKDSDPPKLSVAIVNSDARDFLAACYASATIDLIHYIGSARYALSIFNDAFASGTNCILDGQGNGLAYLDDTFPIDDAVRILTTGATRFNGETCTSINGVLVKDSIYGSVRDALITSFRNLTTGNPLEADTQVGPLFSDGQAVALQKAIHAIEQGQLLCGGEVNGAFFQPAVVEGVQAGDLLAREGFFGPALWLQRIHEDETPWEWFSKNRYPLSDTILSADMNTIHLFTRNSPAARICINKDPSEESMFAPWGGYPPSGLNPVSWWSDKYHQIIQLDGRRKEIMALTEV